MKRTLLTILAIFYLGISSGATMHFHYCMGELVSWSLEKESKDACDFCGMPKSVSKKKSCCKDVQQEVKSEKSHKASQTAYKFEQLSQAIIQPELYVNYQAPIPVRITREALSNAPPDGQHVPVYLKNCTYRI
ncbi:hypothetical protein FBD94_03150 [Pedobacter hiemivivus]|uniref:Uncharacterized protein n=1 Tax=Pedobacter hiemivivus TaxID=2530454 RepID=A0A4R0N7G8_9SPHI|nr:hypothetical protein [Pedobacter hiemivivus]TCC96049.1 hypothetical protein EZ444_13450 [Pedobacter hiemivivus]TKC65560.1 hypothetical protein FBD94_03150 [Pedobacter hiemivivus]